jgi:UDP-glucose:(heptosyl)LPS alpha-1,3-glucosyltransferase
VRFRRVPGVSQINSLSLATFPFLAGRQLARKKYDITHSYGSIPGCDIVSAQSCHKAGLEALAVLPLSVTNESRNWGLADKLRLSIEQRTYSKRQYGRVIACSSSVQRELQSCYSVPATDIQVIPNGVDLDEFNPSMSQSRRVGERERFGIREEDFLLLFVGNEFGRKGLGTVIQSLSEEGLGTTKLLVCGRGKQGPYQRLAAKLGVDNRIIFTGGREDIASYYAAADLFVFPTLHEAFGMVIIEAMACGIPVVVSREAGAADDHLEEGRTALLLDNPSDPGELARRIKQLIVDRDLRTRIAGAGREKVQSLGWDPIARQVLQVYESVLMEKTAAAAQ